MIRKPTIGAALLTASVSAFASNWVSVAENQKSVVAIDTQSIVRKGTTVVVWEQLTYRTPESGYSDHQPTAMLKVRQAIRCLDRTMNSQTYVRIAPDGSILWSGPGDGKFKDIVPDSLAEAILINVCK
ncbi:MAG: hypothetical protein M3O74_13765 [Pseudomonadota bacterium]|nr:hypothetical protein [Pseudomonadota bacterium]